MVRPSANSVSGTDADGDLGDVVADEVIGLAIVFGGSAVRVGDVEALRGWAGHAAGGDDPLQGGAEAGGVDAGV